MDAASTNSDCIKIEQLEVFAHIGVTENERATPQRLTFTITIWPIKSFEDLRDDIARGVNYSAVGAAVRNFASEKTHKLIETLAAQLASQLLAEFPIRLVQIELRKFVLPDADHVSVTVTRGATS